MASKMEFPTLVDALQSRAIQNPDKTALIYLNDGHSNELTMSYQELDQDPMK